MYGKKFGFFVFLKNPYTITSNVLNLILFLDIEKVAI